MSYDSYHKVFFRSKEYKGWAEGAGKAIVKRAIEAKKRGDTPKWTARIEYDDEYGYDQFSAGMDYNYYDQYDYAVDGSLVGNGFVSGGYDEGYYPEQYPMVGVQDGDAMAMQTALIGVLGALMCLVFVVAICIIAGISGVVFGYAVGRIRQNERKAAVDVSSDEENRV